MSIINTDLLMLYTQIMHYLGDKEHSYVHHKYGFVNALYRNNTLSG